MRHGSGMRGGRQRMEAMHSMGSVVYAARLADGKIKIGWTEHFETRLNALKWYVKQDVQLIAFTFGDYADEQAIHESLIAHRATDGWYDGTREYYNPTPEVMAVINGMRASLGMSDLAS